MFSYQHVVVTGGGTGLGKALVQGIFTRGAIVTMVGKDEEKLEQLRNELDVSIVFQNSNYSHFFCCDSRIYQQSNLSTMSWRT